MIFKKASAKNLIWGDGNTNQTWFYVDRPDFLVIQERFQPGGKDSLHFHKNSRQFFYVLSGVATFVVNGKKIDVGPNEGIEIEPGQHHELENVGPEPVEFLCFASPNTRGDNFKV